MTKRRLVSNFVTKRRLVNILLVVNLFANNNNRYFLTVTSLDVIRYLKINSLSNFVN